MNFLHLVQSCQLGEVRLEISLGVGFDVFAEDGEDFGGYHRERWMLC